MQERSYTNPMDRGRFGFSRSGEFRAPLKAEAVIVGIIVLVAILLCVGVFVFSSNIIMQNKAEKETEATFVAGMTIIISAVVVIVIFAVMMVGIRLVRKGMLCKYTANDDTFTATIGGDLHVIRINEVQGISFRPRSMFGKIRGYDITVKVRGVEEHYSICSEGYMSARSTPFYIIQERLDAIRSPHSSYSADIYNATGSSSNSISKAEAERARTGSISAMDRMAQLLGESSNMPELSSSEGAADGSALFGSSSSNQYGAGDMLEVGQSRRFEQNLYGSSNSRDASQVRSAISQGTFFVEPPVPILIIKIIVYMVIWAALVLGTLYVSENYLGLQMEDLQRQLIIYGGLVPSELILMVYMMVKVHGPLHTYKSDGRGLFITPKGQPEQQLFYKDIISIDYKLTKFLGTARGYKVDIMTKSEVVTYRYMFPRFNTKIAKQYLPFEPIRKYIEMRDKPEEEQY